MARTSLSCCYWNMPKLFPQHKSSWQQLRRPNWNARKSYWYLPYLYQVLLLQCGYQSDSECHEVNKRCNFGNCCYCSRWLCSNIFQQDNIFNSPRFQPWDGTTNNKNLPFRKIHPTFWTPWTFWTHWTFGISRKGWKFSTPTKPFFIYICRQIIKYETNSIYK